MWQEIHHGGHALALNMHHGVTIHKKNMILWCRFFSNLQNFDTMVLFTRPVVPGIRLARLEDAVLCTLLFYALTVRFLPVL